MPYKSPTLKELLTRTQADIESKLPGVYARTGVSVAGAIAYANAANAAGLHDQLSWISRQIIPHLADEEQLLAHCEFWGVWRKPATSATGKITVRAENQTTISQGTRWQRPDGMIFESVSEIEIKEGLNEIDVTAVESGKKSNTEANTQLALISPIVYVQPTATVVSIGGGANMESIDSLRIRLIFRVQYPPSGGNRWDYERWALECPGVTRAWCIPRYQGHGTVGVFFVKDDEANMLPTLHDIEQVRNYLTGHINPITQQWEGKTVGAELIVESPNIITVNPKVRLIPNTLNVQHEVQQNLISFLSSIPLGGRVLLSELRATISNSVGEIDNTVHYPTTDLYAANNEFFALGEIVCQ